MLLYPPAVVPSAAQLEQAPGGISSPDLNKQSSRSVSGRVPG